MPFGFDIQKLAKEAIAKEVTKLKALDENHDGIPDLIQAGKDIETGIAELQALQAELTPAEKALAKIVGGFAKGYAIVRKVEALL